MFLLYDHDHSDSYTLSAKDIDRIMPKGSNPVSLDEPLVFEAGVPRELPDDIGQAILDHKPLVAAGFEQVDSLELPDDDEDEPVDAEAAKAKETGGAPLATSTSPGATSSGSAGASSTSSTAGTGGASAASTGTGSSSGN